MTRVLSFLALAMLFVTGVAVGGTFGPAPAYAQSEETCEQDKCDHASWWQFWRGDECVMNSGYLTGCDVIGKGACATYACGQVLPSTEDEDEDD